MLKFYKNLDTNIRKAVLMTAQGPRCVCLIGTAADMYEARIILNRPTVSDACKWLLIPRDAEYTTLAFMNLEEAKQQARMMYQ